VLNQADGDDSKTPSGIMVNPDGEWVIAEPDKASWEQFQAKAKSNASAQKATLEGDKEVQERGLECPIDKKMFIDPMKTPCCEKTYCNDCITNALIESDFICPGCKSDGVLIDDLKPDSEAVERMKAFLAETDSKAKAGSKSPKSPVAVKSPAATSGDANGIKAELVKAKSKSPSPSARTTTTSHASQPSQTTGTTAATPHSGPSTPGNGEQQSQGSLKKRPADESLENPKIPKAPKAMQQQQHQDVQQQQQAMMAQMMAGGMNGMPMMNPMAGMPMMYPGMPMMGNFGGMAMPGMNMGNMNMGMMNPMMGNGMPGYPAMNNGFAGGMQANANAGMWGGPAAGQGMGMNNAGTGAGVGQNMNMGTTGPRMNVNNGGYNPQQQQHGPGFKNFSHQPADDEDAYFRKPVNPHRHQNRQRRARPSDYREL